MRKAIEETERRRAKQMAFNEAHGITPRTIEKQIADVMEGARAPAPGAVRRKGAGPARGSAERIEVPEDPKAFGRLLAELEERMLEHARNLEFEEAAQLRDELKKIREDRLLA